MQKALLFKIAIVLLLAVLINIPLGMMNKLVYERQSRQSQVSVDIANSYAEPQFIAGPLLVFPYTEEYSETQEAGGENGSATRTRIKHHTSAIFLPPRTLTAKGSLATEIKKRSLFEVPVYTLDSTWEGAFEIPKELVYPRHAGNSRVTWDTPYLSLPVKDPRGFASAPLMEMDGKTLTLEQGSGVFFAPNGVKATLNEFSLKQAGSHQFKLTLKLRGTTQLKVIPLADNLNMELLSNWPHPGFEGRYLPIPGADQHVGADGFKAKWEISSLATNAPYRLLEASANLKSCANAACLDSFDVRLVNPGNIYQQSNRALKYGFLFIGITFMAFFLFEMLKRLAIHPAQYTLVGLAQAMFFLLLLSLSEHIAFTTAYLIAATACVVLVGYYLGHVMQGAWRGAGFAALLGACYAALYGLLISEDNALLMGSLLLFILLAVAMVVTRKFDWYGITAPKIISEAAP
ncbi:MAG: cell envelope integrity protein CreD [Gallionella sp.]|nr:cell envelope integrity protein CreD [Gallionella sp.]